MIIRKIVSAFLFFQVLLGSSPQERVPFSSSYSSITPDILKRMPYTWNPEGPIGLEDLRHLTLSFNTFNGTVEQGELIVHKEAVDDLLWIFEQLFLEKFPLTSLRFVDEFGGSDDASMRANNSSAFYARRVAGTNRWSNHASGLAIDINPLLNPYSKGTRISPQEGVPFLAINTPVPGMITKDSTIYKLFKACGWEWGGECFFERDGTIDRHHFQKIVLGVNKTTNDA